MERDRAQCAFETVEERERRLRIQRDRDRARRASRSAQPPETAEEREIRLRRERATRSEEARDAMLQRRDRSASETAEERQARLQRLSAGQRDRLAAETAEERQARLQRDRQSQQERLATQLQTALFEQPSVRAKMAKFHSRLTALEVAQCATCLEMFPGMNMKSVATNAPQECALLQ